MTKKRLTKKQLYGYSYMKWDKLYSKLNFDFSGKCAFCFDGEKDYGLEMCKDCKIDKTLCDDCGEEGLFQEVQKADQILFELVSEMRRKLRERYDKLD